MKVHNKITTGFVVQKYVKLDNGKLVCVGQNFTAGDVEYEDMAGQQVNIETDKEEYQPFDMIQPALSMAAKQALFNTENTQENL